MATVWLCSRLNTAATADEIDWVQQLFDNTGSAFTIAEELQRSYAVLWTVSDGPQGPKVGALLAWIAVDEMQILHVATDPDHRQQGVGRALLQSAFGEALARSCRLILLETRRSNHAALALYKRFGFETVRERKHYYSNPTEDGLEMAASPKIPKQQKRLQLLRRTAIGDAYHVLTFTDPEGTAAEPGQFVMVRGEDWGEAPLLARPMSYLTAGHEPSILIKVFGKGTLAMARAEAGAWFTLMGPLGTQWREPEKDRKIILVGGGVGIAPLIFFAEKLSAAGIQATTVYGGRSAKDLPLLAQLQTLSDVIVTTEDGSLGAHGRVPVVLEALLKEHAQVYTCGPDRMMAKVAELCAAAQVPCEVSLETPMACGYGVCLGCPVPTHDGKYLYACVEGPCMDAGRVDFSKAEHAPVRKAGMPV